MYKSYAELEALPAETYLDWQKFDTIFDNMPEKVVRGRAEAQYNKGLEIGRNAHTVFIGINSVWGADNLDGSSTYSYEGIGYHACTKDLLRGFLDSGANVLVFRYENGKIKEYMIKTRDKLVSENP